MKLFFLDFCFFRGHHNLNVKLLELLSKKYEIEVISQVGYYSEKDKLKLSTIIFNDYNFSYFNNNKGAIIDRIKIVVRMIITFLKIENRKEKLLIVGFENITYGIFSFLFKNHKVYLMHHQNVDELVNRFKYKIFNSYKNKVNHIVLDQFIAKYLVEHIEIKSEKVFYINHPITDIDIVKCDNIEFKERIFVGLSGSNDEKIVEKLIKDSESGKLILDKNIKLVIKSKKFNYESKNLSVFNKFLTENEYNIYIKNAAGFLLLFPQEFRYRMSGTLIDALKNNRIVLGVNIPCVKSFNARYPEICKIINNVEDLNKYTDINVCDSILNIEFENFKMNHSDNVVIQQLEKIFI